MADMVQSDVERAVHDDALPATAAGFEVLERTYAAAIYAQAEKENAAKVVLEEMEDVVTALKAYPELAKIVGSARLDLSERRGLIDRLFTGKVSDATMRALQVIATRERLRYVQGIVRRLRMIDDEKRGLVRVVVDAPVELTEQQKTALVDRLRSGLKIEPRLTCHVKPELLGGMVVRIEDTVYDGSVRSRLDLLRREILTRSVHEIQSGRDRFSYPEGN